MMNQSSSKKMMQAVILLILIFGLITGGIAFLLNLVFKVGDGFQVFLVTALSSIISIIILFWLIFKGLRKVMGSASGMAMGGFPPNMGGGNPPNPFKDLNK